MFKWFKGFSWDSVLITGPLISRNLKSLEQCLVTENFQANVRWLNCFHIRYENVIKAIRFEERDVPIINKTVNERKYIELAVFIKTYISDNILKGEEVWLFHEFEPIKMLKINTFESDKCIEIKTSKERIIVIFVFIYLEPGRYQY